MENNNHIDREIVSKETLPVILKNIADRREEKGTSETLIPHIRKVREAVEQLGEPSIVIKLYWEEILSAQHMIMEEEAKQSQSSPRTAEGLTIMKSAVQAMEEYVEKNDKKLDPAIKARAFRFSGRFADYTGHYKQSEEYYKKGLLYFNQCVNPEERINKLEFLGFLSHSLLKQGKTEEGFNVAQQTLNDFDQSEEGLWLKENNYYVWAVWKSGVEIRTATYIIESKNSEHEGMTKSLLADSERILQMPDGTMEIFRLRLDELAAAKNLLQ